MTDPGSVTRPEPRIVVLGVLLVCFLWALIIPFSLVTPPTTALAVLLAAGLAVFGVALLLLLWSVVNPGARSGNRPVGLVQLAALGLWVPLHAWAQEGERPWAWLAGFVIAACSLNSWWAGSVAALCMGGAALIGAISYDGALIPSILTALGCAVVVWGMSQVFVWLYRLLREAQAGREAQAELAVAEERLRVSRELHDVLGHRLGIIALKAELAAELTGRDPPRAAEESEGIRQLAHETVLDVRRAIRGQPTTTDLTAQLQTAELVLGSAGAEVALDIDPGVISRISPELADLLAAVVREGVTNILRHSEARLVSISIGRVQRRAGLLMVNDGVVNARAYAPGGTGLAGLSARCTAVGARFAAGSSGDGRFRLSVESPDLPGGPG